MKDVASRRKIYGIAFLISGLAMGGVGLMTLWAPDLISSFSMKLILTLVILAGLSSVLFMLTFAKEEKIQKKMSLVIGACVLALSGILVAEIWLDVFNESLLGKLVISLLVIGVLAGFVMSVWEDFFESRRLKDEGYLD